MARQSSCPGTAEIRAWAALIVVLCAHLFMTFRLFPSWESILDDSPVVMVDHAIHLYHGSLGARFLTERGTTWGYDPFFMAGYPETPVWDSSSNLSIAFQAAAGGRYSPRAYKVGLFVCTLLVVGMLPVGAVAAGLKISEAASASALGLVAFWGGFPPVLWKSGLFSFVTASAALGFVLGMLLRFDRRPGWGRWSALASAGAVLLFAHVTAPVLVLGGAVGYLAAVARRWRERRKMLGAVVGAVALGLAVNAFWVVPLWKFRGVRTPAFSFLTADSALYFWNFLVYDPIEGRLALALIALGAVGVASWWAEGARTRAAVFGGAAALLLATTWVGSLWSVSRTLEPIRFRVSLDLLMTVPAGSALVRSASAFSKRGGLVLTWVVFLAVAGGAWFLSPLTVPAIAGRFVKSKPLVVGLPPESRKLVDWLKKETDLSARILFEDQLRLLERTDPESTHWTPLLPIVCGPEGRAFVGGLYQTAFIAHHHAAAFGDYGLGDRRIDAWTPNELDDYVARYNVGWVVCWSPLSRYCFDRYPRARHVATLPRAASYGMGVCRDMVQGRALLALAGDEVASQSMIEGVNHYKVYRIERPRTYFLEGSGRVASFDSNRVALSDVAPDPATGSAVLSLHWLDTWKTDPPTRVSPVYVPGDPVAFVRIKLDGPIRKLVLFNGY